MCDVDGTEGVSCAAGGLEEGGDEFSRWWVAAEVVEGEVLEEDVVADDIGDIGG